jgi:hypothetical protein
MLILLIYDSLRFQVFSLVSMRISQGCGSGFIESGYGFSILSESGSEIEEKKTKLKTIYISLGLHKGRPSFKKSLQPSKRNIQHFKKLNLLTFFFFLLVIFTLLDSDPGLRVRIRIQGPHLIRIRIRIHTTLVLWN